MEEENGVERFSISPNNFLRIRVSGYFHQYYTGFKQEGNPDFLNTLKNTFNSEKLRALIDARDEVIDILVTDIPEIMRENNITNCLCVCVPEQSRMGHMLLHGKSSKKQLALRLLKFMEL